MQVSHTMLQEWRRCRQRFYWHRIRRVPQAPSIGMLHGRVGHEVLALQAEGRFFDVGAAIRYAEHLLAKEPAGVHNLFLDALAKYLSWAQVHDDFRWLLTEQRVVVPLTQEHTLFGIVDGIIRRQDGSFWAVDNKFNKQVSTRHLLLDSQVSIYLAVLQTLGWNLAGMMYNVVRTVPSRSAVPAEREYVFRSSQGNQLVLQEAVAQAREIAALYTGQSLEIYRNPTHDCHWDCSYYHMCLNYQEDGIVSEEEMRDHNLPRSRELVES